MQKSDKFAGQKRVTNCNCEQQNAHFTSHFPLTQRALPAPKPQETGGINSVKKVRETVLAACKSAVGPEWFSVLFPAPRWPTRLKWHGFPSVSLSTNVTAQWEGQNREGWEAWDHHRPGCAAEKHFPPFPPVRFSSFPFSRYS